MASHDLKSGMRCIKYLLFSFNFLFVLTGILLIIVGTTIYAIHYDYKDFLQERYLTPASLLVALGIITFCIAFFGCCGAVRESTCMIMVFACLLGIIFIIEMSAGIAGYVLRDGLVDMIKTKVNDSVHLYKESQSIAGTVDYLQDTMECCGVSSVNDWAGILNETDTKINITLNSVTVYLPDSCGYLENDEFTPYPSGCVRRLGLLINQSSLLLASAALSIGLLQFLGMMFACSLGKAIRAHKTERERRRQELQEQLINSYSPLQFCDPQKTYPVVYIDPKNNEYNC